MKTILLAIFILPIFTMAQTNTSSLLHGKILDASTMQPLDGVTIHLLKSKSATISSPDGTFSLSFSGKRDSILVQLTGFKPYRALVNGDSNLVNIYLESSTAQLEQVTVNTGYQQISKERSTGSFNVINNQLINRSVSTDILSRIENLSPGVLFNHGDASKDETLSIRGRSTIYANASPLIVVDNFPYDGDINNINPNDVESVSILKDAAAASIWGAKAGNGVIVITTKKGTSVQPQIELNINTTVTGKPDLYNINQISGSDYAQLETYLYKQHFYDETFSDPYNSPAPTVATLLHEADLGIITQQDANAQIAALKYHDVRTDLEKYFYRPEVQQQYAFNVSGKTDKINYFLSAGFDRNLASLVGDDLNRITIRSTNSYQASKRLQINTGITYAQSIGRTGNNPGYDYSSQVQSKQYLPYSKLADANGNPISIYEDYSKNFIDTAGGGKLLDWTYKPLADINDQVTTIKNTDYVIYGGFNFQVLNSLHIEGRYQYESQNTGNQTLYNAQSFFTRNFVNNFTQLDPSSGAATYIVPEGGIRDESVSTLTSHQGRLQANFNQAWDGNRHTITAIAGYEIRSAVSVTSNNRIYGYDQAHNTVNPYVDYSNYYPQYSSPDYDQVPSNLYLYGNTDHFISYYANAAYTLNRIYTISASTRTDEANLFGVKTNQKGTPLWSAGAAWELNRESFYHIEALPVLRLRATYGYNGNISRQATAFTTIIYNTGVLTPLPIAIVTSPANPDLRWEETRTINLGVDFALKNNVISGSVEFYSKHSLDLIAGAPADPTLGISSDIANPSFYGNVANMNGKGIDVQLLSANITGRLQWRTFYIFSYTQSKVTKYSMPLSTSGSNYVVSNIVNPIIGKPLYSVYSYPWGGLDHETGNPIGYFNGKQSEDYSSIYSNVPLDSMVYNGPSEPTIYGAIRNEVIYKNFSLSFNISYKLGYYFRTTSVNYGDLFNNWNGSGDYANRWKKPGDENTTHVPSLVYPDDYYRDYFYQYSDVLVEKAGNVRLEDINIAYQVSKQRFKKLPVQQVKLFIYASNLGVLWLADHSGIDPYYNNTARTNKSIALGLNVIF